MPAQKTEEQILTAEILRFQRRLTKLKLDHLAIADLRIGNAAQGLVCAPGYRPEMVRQADGTFRLECVPIT